MTVERRRPRREAIEPDAWYPASFLARRWAVHEITIWKWARTGVIPPQTRLGPNTSRWCGQAILDHEAALMEAAE